MSINLKTLSTTEQLAEITVDKDDVLKSFQDVLKLFQKDSDLKGFRKGKVPLNVIESRYSKEILEELKTRLISFYIRKVSVENKINVVRTSNLEHEDLKKDSAFTFKVNLEIIPEIKLKPYKEISVLKEIQKVTKKDIDEAMKNVLNNFAQNEEVESKRKIKKKDFVDIDFTGSIDGKEIEKLNRKNAVVEIGNESLIPEIEKEILSLKKGEESSFEVVYPKDFPITEAAEKKVQCILKVNKILKKVVPKVDDAFLEKIGFKTVEDLEKRISDDLSGSFEQQAQGSLRKNMFDKLIDDNEFDFPNSFVDDEKNRLEADYKSKMAQQGVTIDGLDEKTTDVINDSAFRNVKIALIFAEISKIENISVEDKEVGDYLAAFASSQNVPIDKVLKYYKDNNLMDDVRVKLTDEKVIQFLISNAKIKEVSKKKDDSNEKDSKESKASTDKKKT
jgi:trigger factor